MSIRASLFTNLFPMLPAAAPVEDAGNAEQRSADPSAGPPSGADFNGDLAATLRALAEQQPDLGGPEGLEGPEGEMLEKLMAQLGALPGMGPGGMGPGMEGGADLGDDGDGADGMSSVVNVIMQQLLSKEVLYQPMKVNDRI